MHQTLKGVTVHEIWHSTNLGFAKKIESNVKVVRISCQKIMVPENEQCFFWLTMQYGNFYEFLHVGRNAPA